MKKVADGLYLIDNFLHSDLRGDFRKFFNKSQLNSINIQIEFNECYLTTSKKNVIRGMHFQNPPNEHWKLVTVIEGSIVDVVIDIRNSENYGRIYSFEMDENSNFSILISPGYAHGFKSLQDHTKLLYHVSSEYSKESDNGILWNSIDFDWQIKNPILSERDSQFIDFSLFESFF
jgi:dTDP-4-dehydrorhamnose 3,5-epimerase/CDP-3, 6-dideoxy-D-glycero-D-glycero-4-hexulose-5-epimerase